MDTLDESLYSRQIYVLGHDAMKKMNKSHVLISGLNGLGIELAKCIILGGIKKVVLHDNTNIELKDMASGYYFNINDINKSKLICETSLKELNPYVSVESSTNDLIKLISDNDFDVVVLIDKSLDENIRINNITHERNIKFISCSSYGGFGSIFCDFGNDFLVNDLDGEDPVTGAIQNVKLENNKLFVTSVGPHKLSQNDVILLNQKFKTKILDTIDRSTFIIDNDNDNNYDDLNNLSTYRQVKQHAKINFKPLIESLKTPEFVITDIMDMQKSDVLHSVYIALDKFKCKYNRLPQIWNHEDADEICKIINNKDFDQNIIKKLSHVAEGKICSLDSLIGCVVAQEVMKACSSKFNPINQWFHYDILDSLPDKGDGNVIKDRYYGQRLIFGDEFQKKLTESTMFIVGAGAIGCELIKNYAMIGVGNMIITDMDIIEKSNLNRQFLFRNFDIGKFKSEIAAREAMKINNSVNIIAHRNKVSNETESIYNEKFYGKLACVSNALDNVQARLYVDEKCVTYKKPLLESGTLGAKGNVQPIIPDLTESYGSTQDQVEDTIPVCTLKNFPYLIQHCVQYGRDIFEGYFTQGPNNLIKYIKDIDSIKKMTPTEIITIMSDIKKIIKFIPKSYSDCLKYGYDQWHMLFRDQIMQLVHNFPKDSKNDGLPFWSGAKKYPNILKFSVDEELHLDFVWTFANLWAEVFGLKNEDKNFAGQILSKMIPYEFIPEENLKIESDPNAKKVDNEPTCIIEMNTDELIDSVNIDKNLAKIIRPLTFEKDDDTNYHIDFIASSSNLRSINYQIETADRHKIKGIAGKIIPAIATTTSLVSSLVTLEFYKIMSGIKDIGKYKSSFVNLAIPFFGSTEPAPAKKTTLGKNVFTFWDSLEFGNVKVKDILEAYNKKYDVEIDDIVLGQARIYSTYLSNKKKKERIEAYVSDIYFEIMDKKPETSPIILTVMSGDGELPACKIYV